MRHLKELKDEKGKSIEELKILHSVEVDAKTGTVNIKLSLT